MTTEEEQTREDTKALEQIAGTVTTVQQMVSGVYDHMNTLIDQAAAIYEVITDRLAFQAAGYGADYRVPHEEPE